jgi:hypothetical protein
MTCWSGLIRAPRDQVRQQRARDKLIGADSEHDEPDRLALVDRVFSRAAESHQMSAFYGIDVDDDILSRLPKARALCDARMETVEADWKAFNHSFVFFEANVANTLSRIASARRLL